MKKSITVGTCVKLGRLAGYVTSIMGQKASVRYHNGMRVRNMIMKLGDLIVISREEFERHCRQQGDTSMLDEFKAAVAHKV